MQNQKSGDVVTSNTIDPQQWVVKYADNLYRYAFKHIKNQDLARDLVQETLLAALEGRAKFEGRSSEFTWLTAILKNKINDEFRKKSTARPEHANLSEPNPFFNADDGHWADKHRPVEFSIDPEESEQQPEFKEILQKCLKKLPNIWFSVFTMKYIDKKTSEAICNQHCITPANFWVIIHRAKVNLRACLQKNMNQ